MKDLIMKDKINKHHLYGTYFPVVVFLLVNFTITSKSIGQVFGNLIESNIQSTVIINTGVTEGSAILVRDTSRIFLVTAKHCLYKSLDNDSIFISNTAEITFYSKNFKDDKQNYILLDLSQLRKNNLLRSDKHLDICVVNIAKVDSGGGIKYNDGVHRMGQSVKYDQYYLSDESIVRKKDIFLGENIFLVGFPGSLGLKQIPQFDYEMPLLKRGAIASTSNKYNTIIIDCPVYHGNSGGPVFLERINFESYKIRLIGIVVEFIPLIMPTVSQNDLITETSSYAVVVPIEYALNLMNSFH